MSDNLMMVGSMALVAAANRLDELATDHPPVILRNGAKANAAQLKKAAQLLRDAEPSICNGIVAERPGYIDRDKQEDGLLVFEVGILPTDTYKIDSEGRLV